MTRQKEFVFSLKRKVIIKWALREFQYIRLYIVHTIFFKTTYKASPNRLKLTDDTDSVPCSRTNRNLDNCPRSKLSAQKQRLSLNSLMLSFPYCLIGALGGTEESMGAVGRLPHPRWWRDSQQEKLGDLKGPLKYKIQIQNTNTNTIQIQNIQNIWLLMRNTNVF